MLRQRLLTGSIAGLCVIAGLLWLPATVIVATALLVGGMAAVEWGRLAGLVRPGERWAYAGGVGLLGLIPAGVVAGLGGLALTWLALAVLIWLLITLWIVLGGRPRSGCGGRRRGWLLLGLVLMPAMIGALGWLVYAGEVERGIVLYAVALVWLADTGAYFTGRRFGHYRLAPAISAGKTWEGVGGGLAAVALFAVVIGLIAGFGGAALFAWTALAVGAAALSVVGDLLESVLKREAGVKDSGTILPGHGGLLDRIDSQMAALPLMALGLTWLPGVGT